MHRRRSRSARRRRGRRYDDHDAVFLVAAASQVGLALTNARAFGQLAELNASLEDQVRERTAALEVANRDLNRSLRRRSQRPSEQLEQSQTSLMRADRLATLGRLDRRHRARGEHAARRRS